MPPPCMHRPLPFSLLEFSLPGLPPVHKTRKRTGRQTAAQLPPSDSESESFHPHWLSHGLPEIWHPHYDIAAT